MAICYLGVGTNLGKRRKNINLAIKKINVLEDSKVLKISRIIQTKPQGGPLGQPKFLNAVLKIRTKFSPVRLLKKIKTIEKEMGRVKAARFGPRTIDLDILLYGDRIIKQKGLEIPHPRMVKRYFVIKPLLEVI